MYEFVSVLVSVRACAHMLIRISMGVRMIAFLLLRLFVVPLSLPLSYSLLFRNIYIFFQRVQNARLQNTRKRGRESRVKRLKTPRLLLICTLSRVASAWDGPSDLLPGHGATAEVIAGAAERKPSG